MLLEELQLQENEIGADLQYVEEEESGIVSDFDTWYDETYLVSFKRNLIPAFVDTPIEREKLREECLRNNVTLFLNSPVGVLDHKAITPISIKLDAGAELSLANVEILYDVFKSIPQIDPETSQVLPYSWSVRAIFK